MVLLQIRDLAQERITSKWLQLRDLGYCKGLVAGVGRCYLPVEARTSHHKPLTKRHLTVKPEMFMNNKQVFMINEMIKILYDPRNCRNVQQMGVIRSRNEKQAPF